MGLANSGSAPRAAASLPTLAAKPKRCIVVAGTAAKAKASGGAAACRIRWMGKQRRACPGCERRGAPAQQPQVWHVLGVPSNERKGPSARLHSPPTPCPVDARCTRARCDRCEELLSQQPPQAAKAGGGAASSQMWSYAVLRVLQLQRHVPPPLLRQFASPPPHARLVFACGALAELNRFVRHGLRLPAQNGAPPHVLAVGGLTIADELSLALAQTDPAEAPALLVSRVVLAVAMPSACGRVATMIPSYVVDYALEAQGAQLGSSGVAEQTPPSCPAAKVSPK